MALVIFRNMLREAFGSYDCPESKGSVFRHSPAPVSGINLSAGTGLAVAPEARNTSNGLTTCTHTRVESGQSVDFFL